MTEKTNRTVRRKSKLHERMCIACGNYRGKEALLRIIKTEDGFVFDHGKKAGGRGAYVCMDPACMERMCAKRLLNRSFRMTIPEDAYRKLQEDYQRIYG